MKKKWAVSLGILLSVLGGLLLTLYLLTFAGAQSGRVVPALDSRLQQVVDGIASIYLVDLGNGKVALIDAGLDPKGKQLLAALAARSLTTDDVVAIFLTHSHSDHIGSIGLFPKAVVYISKQEVPVAEGREPFGNPISLVVGKYNGTPFKVGHPLEDGEKVTLGDTVITSYFIPGHTAGSTAYLVHGSLFLGDSINFRSGGKVGGPWWIFSKDTAQAKNSLRQLADRLVREKADVRSVLSAHTGGISGLGNFVEFAVR